MAAREEYQYKRTVSTAFLSAKDAGNMAAMSAGDADPEPCHAIRDTNG
jgi:hypothetical protein